MEIDFSPNFTVRLSCSITVKYLYFSYIYGFILQYFFIVRNNLAKKIINSKRSLKLIFNFEQTSIEGKK